MVKHKSRLLSKKITQGLEVLGSKEGQGGHSDYMVQGLLNSREALNK